MLRLIALMLCALSPLAVLGEEISVFAAASLTESFREIGKAFEKANPDAKVTFSFGASNQLRLQMEHGAAADIFASANTKEMDAAVKAGLVDAKAVHIFAENKLILIAPRENPAKIESIKDLARQGTKLVIADAGVPVGKYALEMFDRLTADKTFGSEFKTKALANVVSKEDNVKSVVAKVRLGEADAGIVYATDYTLEVAKDSIKFDVPAPFNPVAPYPLATLAKAKSPKLAEKFAAYVLSEDGQKVLARYGFAPGTVK